MDDDYRDLNRNREEERNSRDYREETAAETIPTGVANRPNMDEATEDRAEKNTGIDSGRGYGFFALALSVLSLFFLPVVMGAAGIIIGFIARGKGANALGGWAIGLGIASIVISLFAAPFL